MKRQRFIHIADKKESKKERSQPQFKVLGMEKGSDLLALLKPYVRHCGDSHRPAWRIGARKLLDYLLVYIAEGRGKFQLGKELYEVHEGDLFWVPPGTLHIMEGFPPSMHCPYIHFDLIYSPDRSHWDFSIPAEMLDLTDVKSLMHPEINHPLLNNLKGLIRGHTNRRVGQLIREICFEAMRAQSYSSLKTGALLLEVIAEILRGQEALPHELINHTTTLENIARLISKKGYSKFTVKELAASASLSQSHFRCICKKYFGVPPRIYLRNIKLTFAKELMQNTSLTLSEIAYKCGFETIHSFSKAFAKAEGISPSMYRRCSSPIVYVEGRKNTYPR
jgi:AraC-like DNA-binding protein